MTISAHRSRLIWTPLLGWILLSCGLSVANAQSPTQSDADPSSPNSPSVPAGGAAPIIVTTGGTTGTQTRAPGSPTLQDPTFTAPAVPSAGTTIVNAPFGTSVPYYGGITSLGSTLQSSQGGSMQAPEEYGIGLGAFTLIPQIELNVGVDSNVFAQSASLGPTGSVYTTISPSFELKSDWSNHMLHVLGSATFGYYNSAPTQNFQNYGLIVDGKIDVHHDINITWQTGYRRSTEALGTPNVAFAQAPTVVNTVPLEIGLYQEFNDVFYQIGARATRYWHQDFSVIGATGLPAESRDRTEYAETLRVGYHVNEDFDVFLAPSMQQTRYLQKINAAGQQRDSEGTNLSFGATWRINPISVIEGDVGLQTKNDPSAGGSTSTLSYGLRGNWTGYSPLTLRPTISRSINETALSNYSNYISTTFAVDFTYQIHNEWTLAGGLLYQTADYTPVPGLGASPRTDTFMRGQIGLLYSIRPEIQIGPFMEYSRGSSTDSQGPAYDRQIYSIRLVAKR